MDPFNVVLATSGNWDNNQVVWNGVWFGKLEVLELSLEKRNLVIGGDHGQLVLVEPDSLLAVLDPCSYKHVEIQFQDISDEIVVEELLNEIISSILVFNVDMDHGDAGGGL